MVVLDVGILWLFLASALVVLMQAQAVRLAKTNRELAANEQALRVRNTELDAVNSRLSEMDALKSRFLSGVAQELQRPLATLMSEAKLLQRGHYQNAAMVERLSAAILDEGEQLERLISGLPERGSTDWGSLEANERRLDPALVLREATNTIEGVAACQGVTIECDAPDGLSSIWANHDRLVHALVLVLDSAITYTPRGRSVAAQVAMAGPEVQFRIVQSGGPGLPQSKIKEIFESRCTAGNNGHGEGHDGSEKTSGGFALALCREIVESHRGRFWTEGSAAEETVFYIALPAINYEPRAATYHAHSDREPA